MSGGVRNIRNAQHTWVITREKTGMVLVWETTQGITFELPKRWHPGRSVGYANTMYAWGGYLKDWKVQVSDAIQEMEDNAGRPSDPLMMLKQRKDAIQRSHLFSKLPISPHSDFLKVKKELLLPYYSIETCFNDKNVWGNMRNHDPLFIYYDFIDSNSWKPMFTIDEKEIKKYFLIHQKAADLVIGPAFNAENGKAMAKKYRSEMEEAIRFERLRLGLQTKYYKSRALGESLSEISKVLEKQCHLDPAHAVNSSGSKPSYQRHIG